MEPSRRGFFSFLFSRNRSVYSGLLAALLFVVFVGFQNCSPQKVSTDDHPGTSSGPSPAVIGKVSPDYYGFLSFPAFPFNDPALGDRADLRDSFLKLNLRSGEISMYVFQRSSGQPTLCHQIQLFPQLSEQIQDFLSSSQLCKVEKQPVLEEGLLCTAIYGLPYATLNTQKDPAHGYLNFDHQEDFPLGEKRSGCYVPSDFCEAKSVDLKKIIEIIQQTYSDELRQPCNENEN